MAKRPEDRFQSASELGRAGLAAAAGRTDLPTGETVATGESATADMDPPTQLSNLPPATDRGADPALTSSGAPKVTVIVVDDHPFFRDGVSSALDRSGRITVIAEADNCREALETIRRESPTVALVDYEMPEMEGIALVHAVVHEQLATRVLLLSAIIESGTVFRAVEEGAAGYLSKNARRQDIIGGVLSAAQGNTVVPAELAAGLAAEIRRRAH
jgi:CheY-like chemotaxis protein